MTQDEHFCLTTVQRNVDDLLLDVAISIWTIASMLLTGVVCFFFEERLHQLELANRWFGFLYLGMGMIWVFVMLYLFALALVARWCIYHKYINPHICALPTLVLVLSSESKAFSVLVILYFLMPTTVEDQAESLVVFKRPEWIRDYGRPRADVLTYRFLGWWLLKEVWYLAVHPFRLIKREIFRP